MVGADGLDRPGIVGRCDLFPESHAGQVRCRAGQVRHPDALELGAQLRGLFHLGDRHPDRIGHGVSDDQLLDPGPAGRGEQHQALGG